MTEYTFDMLTEEEKQQLSDSPLTRDDEATIVKHLIEKRDKQE